MHLSMFSIQDKMTRETKVGNIRLFLLLLLLLSLIDSSLSSSSSCSLFSFGHETLTSISSSYSLQLLHLPSSFIANIHLCVLLIDRMATSMNTTSETYQQEPTVGFLVIFGEIINNEQRDETHTFIKQALSHIDVRSFEKIHDLFNNLIDKNEFQAGQSFYIGQYSS
jgi:hypothetical protein